MIVERLARVQKQEMDEVFYIWFVSQDFSFYLMYSQ